MALRRPRGGLDTFFGAQARSVVVRAHSGCATAERCLVRRARPASVAPRCLGARRRAALLRPALCAAPAVRSAARAPFLRAPPALTSHTAAQSRWLVSTTTSTALSVARHLLLRRPRGLPQGGLRKLPPCASTLRHLCRHHRRPMDRRWRTRCAGDLTLRPPRGASGRTPAAPLAFFRRRRRLRPVLCFAAPATRPWRSYLRSTHTPTTTTQARQAPPTPR